VAEGDTAVEGFSEENEWGDVKEEGFKLCRGGRVA